MPLSNKLPNSLRYFRGRLRILKRPMVWGSAAAMLLAVILFSEYWKHPEWFTSSEEYTSKSGVASLDDLPNSGQYEGLPSQEDSAIGADIDSLPVLLNDLALNNPNNPAQVDQANANASSPSGQTNNPNEQQITSATTAATSSERPESEALSIRRNPFAATPQNVRLFDLNLPGIDRANNNSPESNSNLNSGFAAGFDLLANPAQSPQNPLGSALQQYAPRNGNETEASNTSQRSPNTINNTSSQTNVNQSTLNGRLQPNQPIPSGLLPTTSLQTSPPIGSTGYTLPPILQTTPSSAPSSNPYSNIGRSQTVPGLPAAPQLAPTVLPQTGNVGRSTVGTPTYGVNQGSLVNPYNLPSSTNPRPAQAEYDAPNPQPAPFTAPYSQGGGEINTFSNP